MIDWVRTGSLDFKIVKRADETLYATMKEVTAGVNWRDIIQKEWLGKEFPVQQRWINNEITYIYRCMDSGYGKLDIDYILGGDSSLVHTRKPWLKEPFKR